VAGTTKWNGVERGREERGEQSPRRKGKHEKGGKAEESEGLTRKGRKLGAKVDGNEVVEVARLQLSRGKPAGQKRTTGKRENFGREVTGLVT